MIIINLFFSLGLVRVRVRLFVVGTDCNSFDSFYRSNIYHHPDGLERNIFR